MSKQELIQQLREALQLAQEIDRIADKMILDNVRRITERMNGKAEQSCEGTENT